ncbi:MAG: Fe-S cluster assembly protein SufB, partial [Chloroflexi bacterium]|nr:Fe-S cluster assembly protein SufB [Chloroflexota bacterium]
MTTPTTEAPVTPRSEYEYGFHDDVEALVKLPKGLSREVVNTISDIKEEPEWMRKLRLKALDHFNARPMPEWGGELGDIDFNDIHYYVRATDRDESDWDDVPDYIKDTYDKLGIPEAEKQGLLAGVGAQYDSEVVYHNI